MTCSGLEALCLCSLWSQMALTMTSSRMFLLFPSMCSLECSLLHQVEDQGVVGWHITSLCQSPFLPGLPGQSNGMSVRSFSVRFSGMFSSSVKSVLPFWGYLYRILRPLCCSFSVLEVELLQQPGRLVFWLKVLSSCPGPLYKQQRV